MRIEDRRPRGNEAHGRLIGAAVAIAEAGSKAVT
jgi:hypothetical protein